MSSKQTDNPTITNLQGERLPINRFVLFFAPVIIGVTVDLITKRIVFAKYHDPENLPQQHWWIDGILGIETSTNGGALFGMGQGYHFWFAALSIFAIIGVMTWLFVFKAARDRILTLALGMVCGGILGNLYDRLGFGYTTGFPEATKYHVRDWIHFRLEGVPLCDPWPNFNIADSLLVCGAIFLFAHAFFFSKTTRKSTTEKQSDQPTEADQD